MTRISYYLPGLLFLLLTGCQNNGEHITDDSELQRFSLLETSQTGVDFHNEIVNKQDFNIFSYRNFYNGGGVAIGDVNNDGLPDIYLTANMGPNKLYLNQGDLSFKDISSTAGIEGTKPWSTGVVMADVNSDGLLDIYVCNAGKKEGNSQDNELFINNGDLTFTEMADKYNLAKSGFTIHATFFDYDKDGDLDAYIVNNINIPVNALGYAHQRDKRAEDWDMPEETKGMGDMLLRNDDGIFTDVSEEAGIYSSLIGFGLGVMVSDVNGDRYPDLYISNDFYERDYLYINNQDGTFTESIRDYTSHIGLSAMGVDMADVNNDGQVDIFITDMLPEGDERVKSVMEFEGYNVFKLKQNKDFYQQYIQNTLQLNNGNGSFSEIAYFSGLSATDWSWSGLIFDMDGDGLRDIYVTNGINHDLTNLDFMDFFANEIIQELALTGKKEAIDSIINKMPVKPLVNYAFKNNGDLTFSNQAKNWGMDIAGFSNGAAYGDLDRDGDLDLVVNNVNMDAFVYRNNSRELDDHHYLRLEIKGSAKNPFAIGTTVQLYFDDKTVLQELIPTRGFQSSMEYPMTIPLGTTNRVDSLRVIFPDNRTIKLTDLAANQTLKIDQASALDVFELSSDRPEPLLTELPNDGLLPHRENAYNDFDYEGLLARKLSQEGPAMAVADVNGDGNEDIFIGGAKNQPGVLYLHSGKASLQPAALAVFEADRMFEDTAAAFLDSDGDGDLDLMVGSGGNQVNESGREGIRLYLNDGSGNFRKFPLNQPESINNLAVIAPYDFDQDGDTDIFVGSRNIIGIYGVDPTHLLLENKGNNTFENVFNDKGRALAKAGMITDARWVDLIGDPRKELVTVSDWGNPMLYTFDQDRLQQVSWDLDDYMGWWNAVEAVDIDQDGDQDLIIGNEGKNLHYRPTQENVMKLWVNDFDANGTIEQVITQTVDGKDKPLHQKKDIVAQMSSLKKKNLKASDYARRSIQELFPKTVINNSRVRKVNTSETILVINKGDGNFEIKALPARAQLSCVCGITCTDIDQDGNLDIVMGGNDFEFKPQFSRLDANYGTVLLNDGNLNFQWQNYQQSGMFVREEIKHIAKFSDKDGNQFIILTINDEKPRIFKVGS